MSTGSNSDEGGCFGIILGWISAVLLMIVVIPLADQIGDYWRPTPAKAHAATVVMCSPEGECETFLSSLGAES